VRVGPARAWRGRLRGALGAGVEGTALCTKKHGMLQTLPGSRRARVGLGRARPHLVAAALVGVQANAAQALPVRVAAARGHHASEELQAFGDLRGARLRGRSDGQCSGGGCAWQGGQMCCSASGRLRGLAPRGPAAGLPPQQPHAKARMGR